MADKRQVIAVAITITALLIGAFVARQLLTSGAATRPLVVFRSTTSEKAVLTLLNKQRKAHGLAPLKYDPVLAKFARAHSANMVARNYFDHDTPGGPTYAQRAGALLGHNGRHRIEENIAWGSGSYGTPAGLVDAWMHSPPHRANILSPLVHRVGEGNIAARHPYQGVPGATVATTEFSN